MIYLDSTLKKLQLVLAGAVTTSQADVVVNYSDKTATAYSGGSQDSVSNNTTAVDICAAPAASTVRDVNYVSIVNNDTAAITVTVRLNNNGTSRTIITATLSVGWKLEYTHARGWHSLNSQGQESTVGPKGDTGATGSQGIQGPPNTLATIYVADFYGAP